MRPDANSPGAALMMAPREAWPPPSGSSPFQRAACLQTTQCSTFNNMGA